MSSSPALVLSFAASDPGGGAGIQADLLTIGALGGHPLSVVTGLTVQDTIGVHAVHATSAELVEAQARALLDDFRVDAFKIGMLGSVANVEAVARVVAAHPTLPLVFDPVLASGRGDEFSGDAIIAAMRTHILPKTTVLTPNSIEARRLLGAAAATLPLADCARRLIELGCAAVLVTGTHEDTPSVANTLYTAAGEVDREIWPRLPGSYHGSGCTLASALATLLARGRLLEEANREAQHYTWHALAAGFAPGRGQFIPDRFYASRAGRNENRND